MPARWGVIAILSFWLVVTGLVAWRELLPRWQYDSPEAAILLIDEATRALPSRWSVWRGDQRIGLLTTRMNIDDARSGYNVVSEYHQLTFEVSGFKLLVRQLVLGTQLHLDGRLAGQTMRLAFALEGAGLALEGTAAADSQVDGGLLVGRCRVDTPLFKLNMPLEPVPVRAGPVLNPLQPLPRLRNVRPGQRWVMKESNPLGEAIGLLLRKIAQDAGLGMLVGNLSVEPPEFIAEVLRDPQLLIYRNNPVACHVIVYRGERVTARTWVAVADGQILQQEASSWGEVLRLERED